MVNTVSDDSEPSVGCLEENTDIMTNHDHVLVSAHTMPCSQQSLIEARNDQSQDELFKETLTDHEPPSYTPTNKVKETMDAKPSMQSYIT